MAGESFTVETIAHVVGGRIEPTDDDWGGARATAVLRSWIMVGVEDREWPARPTVSSVRGTARRVGWGDRTKLQ